MTKAGVVLQFLNGHIVTATLDKEGRFDFVHLPPGEYKLSAWNHLGLVEYREASFLDGYADRSKKIDLDANTLPSLLELTPILLPE